jgi:hypothetical protein
LDGEAAMNTRKSVFELMTHFLDRMPNQTAGGDAA